ncbi:glycosyltransferase [Vibrio fluvialis]|nr:glycosyltransferase [Vibrio fluvialis]MBY8077487.1 glycosyltransferase [Vibrio fluvialis]MBY8147889.1 glycosyltransferase [Vibrio fluvialis]
MSLKVCVFITLYNQESVDINKLIEISKICDYVYVYDNSECKFSYQKNLFSLKENIFYNLNYINDGISKALNAGCEFAINKNCSHILFFDQDSSLSYDDLRSYIDGVSQRNDIEGVAAFSPNIICEYVNKNKYLCKKTEEDKKWLITSGALINLDIYKRTCGFDENLFIDLVDIDYCITVRKIGYKLIQLPTPIMYHSLGEVKKVFGMTLYQHSSLRNYYMFRNRLYIHKKHYGSYFSFSLIKRSLFHIFKIVIFEDDKINKLSNINKAFGDVCCGKYGKYSKLE